MYGQTGTNGTCPAARERFHRQVQCPRCKEPRYEGQEGCDGCDAAAALAAELARQGERKRKERQLMRERRAAEAAKPIDLEGGLPWLRSEEPEDEDEIDGENEGRRGTFESSEGSVSVVDKGALPRGADVMGLVVAL